MLRKHSKFIVAISLILLLTLTPLNNHSNAATPNEFAAANSAIAAAFSATYNAGQNGGNVTSLVAKLNSAIALLQEAGSENMSNPSQASIDLQNAVQIAQQVSTQAPAVGQAGAAAKQTLAAQSIGGMLAIAILGVLAYVFGGRIYRMIWFVLYRERVVRRENG
ncbi:MAG: hypothetical protein ACRECH_05415 [Nitrososphaerales archaeon]